MTLGTRVRLGIPMVRPGSGRALQVVERNLMVYRRQWLVIFAGFFEPVFYLFSIGVGLGQLVGDVTTGTGQSFTYIQFVAPALLAASVMNGSVVESTTNVYFKLKVAKTYHGMSATPITPSDIAIGEVAWSLIRGFGYAVGFVVVMVVGGLMPSWWGLLALPAAVLIGFAFAAVGMATTTFMRSWNDFDMVILVTMLLFLFSATFYPLEVYPGWLQAVVRISPLYHGVDLMRGLTLGVIDASLFGHFAFLVVMGSVGLRVASHRMGKLLLR